MARRFVPSGLAPAAAGEKPDFVPLVRSWGGVSIVYRKRLVDSPAYRLNHEEVIKALEEGISFIENMSPEEAVVDDGNNVDRRPLQGQRSRSSNLPARSDDGGCRNHSQHHLREGIHGKFSARQQEEVFCPASRQAERRRQLRPRAGGRWHWRILYVLQQGRAVDQLLRRQSSALRRQRR